MITPVAFLFLSTSTVAVRDPSIVIPPAGPNAIAEVREYAAERISKAQLGPSWVETMAEVEARERLAPPLEGIHYPPEPGHPAEDLIEELKEEANEQAREAEAASPGTSNLGGSATSPTFGASFQGPAIGGAGGGWIPPDTCGAVGPSHFVSVVNAKLVIYNKGGTLLSSVGQGTFFATGSLGDGRAAFDPHSGRFIVLTENFSDRIYVAVSTTSDPTGSWFKTSFATNGGSDGGTWPDYPTLGVDANGIYTACYQVGAGSMTIFALDKAPMIAPVPSLGAVTAFRGLPWQGAIQPCVTYGSAPGEYLISYSLLYRVNPPLAAPSLTAIGASDVGNSGSVPPDAPNLGGATLDTLDARLMNSVYRNGRIWTVHAINVSGRSGVKWAQIDPTAPSGSRRVQCGTIDDPVIHYFAPGISVNANGSMVVGFTGSSAAQFAAAYVAGRKSSDTAGQVCAPIQIKPGESSYNDGGVPSRWGDYALTSIDPTNDIDFWSIAEYAESGGAWGTWIAQVIYDTCVPVAPTNFCVGAANSYTPAGAQMSYAGSNSISQNNFELQTFNVPPNKSAMYIYGTTQISPLVFGNGFRCIGNPLYRVKPLTTSNALGDVTYPLDLNTLPPAGAISAGQTWHFMCWYRDPPAGGAQYNGSDALSTFWCP